MLRLGCGFTFFCSNEGLSHIFYSVCSGLGTGIEAHMVVPGAARALPRAQMHQAVPSRLAWLMYRNQHVPPYLTQQLLLKQLARLDAAYLFPAISLDTVRRIHARRKPIILERVNCAQSAARRILDEAYRRLNHLPAHSLTTESIAAERDEIARADYLFCPSPHVRESFLEFGVPHEKLIASSYGWSPRRFGEIPQKNYASEDLTVLFVGHVSVRKGAHLILRAWADANVRGQLILCGSLEPAIANTCRVWLERSDVVHIPFQQDIGAQFRRADLFALPTLEEGGPLVTYEAMAHGLPILTTPMGAGAVMRDNYDGKILEPYDHEAWVEMLRAFARSPELRARYGNEARLRAQEFTWDQVAARRGKELLKRLQGAAA